MLQKNLFYHDLFFLVKFLRSQPLIPAEIRRIKLSVSGPVAGVVFRGIGESTGKPSFLAAGGGVVDIGVVGIDVGVGADFFSMQNCAVSFAEAGSKTTAVAIFKTQLTLRTPGN